MAFLAKAMKATSVSAVIQVRAHVYFVGGTSCISALQRHASFVLVPVGDSLTWTALRIPVELRHRHDGSRVLEERGQGLFFWHRWHRRKDAFARGVMMGGCALLYNTHSVIGIQCLGSRRGSCRGGLLRRRRSWHRRFLHPSICGHDYLGGSARCSYQGAR